jgi:hypothetical protein
MTNGCACVRVCVCVCVCLWNLCAYYSRTIDEESDKNKKNHEKVSTSMFSREDSWNLPVFAVRMGFHHVLSV